MIRISDIIISLVVLVILLPLFIIISIIILIDSRGPVLYKQKRVGINNSDFVMFKFRTMYSETINKNLLLTIGAKDPRITYFGRFLRKYKLDELPQLLNVLLGNMSLVGPRPEVRKYVKYYTPQEQKVLSIKPGITDYASLVYYDENELLSLSNNPEELYINRIMREKLSLNMEYINNRKISTYFKIIFLTLKRIIH